MERFLERAHRLYEQDRREPCGSPRLDAYVRRWSGWALAGLPGQPVKEPLEVRKRCVQGRLAQFLSRPLTALLGQMLLECNRLFEMKRQQQQIERRLW